MRFKIGQKVKCINMPENYGAKLKVGQVYTVLDACSMEDPMDCFWITVEKDDYEAQYEESCFEEYVEVKFDFVLEIAGGLQYNITCTKEGMKELAEVIGDDHLVGISTMTPDGAQEFK